MVYSSANQLATDRAESSSPAHKSNVDSCKSHATDGQSSKAVCKMRSAGRSDRKVLRRLRKPVVLDETKD
jgi:hypothetical protein